MAIMSAFTLIPFAWPLLSAIGKKQPTVSGLYLYWPAGWTLANFQKAISPEKGDALRALVNSLLTSTCAVALTVVACAFAGYALSRMQFRGKRPLLYGILLLQVIPYTAIVLPLYLLLRDLRLVNNLVGVTLGMAASQVPFVTWVMKGFFDDVPKELEEAAWLDGAGRTQTLAYVILPLALPGVGAASVLAFNACWGQFFMPMILLSDAKKFILPLALFRALIGYTAMDYGMMNAMAVIYMMPSLVFFLVARKYLIRGAMAGAMAGQ